MSELFLQATARAFNQCAHTYQSAAQVMDEIGRRLIERLDYMTLAPRAILDLGCGPGFFLRQLSARYPHVPVLGLDLAHNMLREARANSPEALVCADMHVLPFADQSFDLVFANQVLYWSHDWSAVLAELQRVIRPGGCLMFSILGLDTYAELSGVHLLEQEQYKPLLFDMHPVGDALLAAGFIDPVVDMQQLVAQFSTQHALAENLSMQALQSQFAALPPSTPVQLSYEIIYGQAWRSENQQAQQGGDVFVPVDILRKPRK